MPLSLCKKDIQRFCSNPEASCNKGNLFKILSGTSIFGTFFFSVLPHLDAGTDILSVFEKNSCSPYTCIASSQPEMSSTHKLWIKPDRGAESVQVKHLYKDSPFSLIDTPKEGCLSRPFSWECGAKGQEEFTQLSDTVISPAPKQESNFWMLWAFNLLLTEFNSNFGIRYCICYFFKKNSA